MPCPHQLCHGTAHSHTGWLCIAYRVCDVLLSYLVTQMLPVALGHISALVDATPTSQRLPAQRHITLIGTKSWGASSKAIHPCKPFCTHHLMFPSCPCRGCLEPLQSCGEGLLPHALGRPLPPCSPNRCQGSPEQGGWAEHRAAALALSCTGTTNSGFPGCSAVCSLQSCTRAQLVLLLGFFFV